MSALCYVVDAAVAINVSARKGTNNPSEQIASPYFGTNTSLPQVSSP